MKTLLIALNARFSHSNLAVYYLKAYCGTSCGDIEILEFTINDDTEWILRTICEKKPDNIAFSCYIWNIQMVSRLISNIKKIMPGVCIIAGGPEVSFDTEKVFRENPGIDYIITGEGEIPFRNLLQSLKSNDREAAEEIEGVAVKGKSAGQVYCRVRENLDSIPSPLTGDYLATSKNRIVYMETTRGCPFACTYCLSSRQGGVSNFSLERVRSDLEKLLEARVKQVKFVDRTFNADNKRARRLLQLLYDTAKQFNMENEINFHFEAAPDLFDDETLALLETFPEGLIQLEMGIQSVNPETIKEINRRMDIDKAFGNIKRIIAMKNIHVHVDLIAGLPNEDYDSFKRSFNLVYALKPHYLQLGFLKLLKGTKIREDTVKHGYIFRDYPPYEVLSNRYMSYECMFELKYIEEVLERYYNSGRFTASLDYIMKFYDTPFDFYQEFAEYNRKRGYLSRPISSRECYDIMAAFYQEHFSGFNVFSELLKLDFLATDRSGYIPSSIIQYSEEGFKEMCFRFLNNEENIERHLPQFKGHSYKEIIKWTRFEVFRYLPADEQGLTEKPAACIILFDYSSRNKVTSRYKYHIVNL